MTGPLDDAPLAPPAAWIWSSRPRPGQYLRLRRAFDLARRPSRAWLVFAVETDAVVFVNGVRAGGGQFSDWPGSKTWTRLDVAGLLVPGANVVAVAAFHEGLDNSVRCAGTPGMILALDGDLPRLVSGPDWRCSEDPAYRQGPAPALTPQLGMVFERDDRGSEPWTDVGYDDAGWDRAAPVAFPPPGPPALAGRPVPPLRVGAPLPVAIAGCGHFIRTRREGTVAEQMAGDALVALEPPDLFTAQREPADYHAETATAYCSRLLDGRGLQELAPPPPGFDGCHLVLDLGREEVGFLTLRVEAPAGTVIDLGHGEHLRRGRVTTSVGGRNFADRYVCGGGVHEFTHWFRRLGCRYVEAHVLWRGGPVRIGYLGLRPAELVVERPAPFRSSDALLDRLDAVAERTLRLCMHEHYEDCPWREQALYAFDGRNQALYGYHAFGNHGFAAASLDLFAAGVRPDGWLPLCAPSRIYLTIPVFSLAWIGALAEHWLFSGDGRTARGRLDTIRGILAAARAAPDPASGLYRTPSGRGIWNFYEWSDGLAGRIPGGDEAVASEAGLLEAPYNLFLLEALGDAAWILRQAGDAPAADRLEAERSTLAAAITAAFWDEAASALATFRRRDGLGHHAELTQALALSAGVLPPGQAERACARLRSGALAPATLSSMRQVATALAAHAPESRRHLESVVRRKWGSMLQAGASSFWETENGADDFDGAGSLCHGWSAFPVYYNAAVHLGIRPLEPGFRRFLLSPYAGALHRAEGAMPTPHGPIRVAWSREGDGVALEASGPEALVPVPRPLPECPLVRCTYNGRACEGSRVDADHARRR